MSNLLGAVLGAALLVFGLATGRDSNIIIGGLAAFSFVTLYLLDRKTEAGGDSESKESACDEAATFEN